MQVRQQTVENLARPLDQSSPEQVRASSLSLSLCLYCLLYGQFLPAAIQSLPQKQGVDTEQRRLCHHDKENESPSYGLHTSHVGSWIKSIMYFGACTSVCTHKKCRPQFRGCTAAQQRVTPCGESSRKAQCPKLQFRATLYNFTAEVRW